jgi:uncharacterized membrane protein YqgA involved in biofilm formation
MEQVLIAIVAFILGFVCGKVTNFEVGNWVKKHGKKANKSK